MDDKETWKNKMTKNTACKLNSNPMVTKHTTVIIPSKEIESLKEQVRQLTAERDEFQRQVIEAEIKVEKIKLLMEDYQMPDWDALKDFTFDNPNEMPNE